MRPHRHFRLTLGQKKLMASLVLASATFVVFSSALNNDFVGWDDDFYILGNPFISPLDLRTVARMFSGFYFSSWTPLALLSHAVDYALWGLDPRGHHLTNLIAHAANTVWVFLISLEILPYARYWREGRSPAVTTVSVPEARPLELAGALIAAVMFSWHPLRVESVACASSRKEILCAFFAFPAVYAYLQFRLREHRRAALWYAAALLLFLLALLAKAAVMTWPVVLIGFELLQSYRKGEKASLKSLTVLSVPFFFVAGAVAAVAYLASRSTGTVNMLGASPTLLLPPYNFWFYLQKTIWPVDMSVVYSVPQGAPLLLGAIAGMATVLGVVLLAWRGPLAPLAALAFYTITLLPVLGIVPTSIQAIANRYSYLAAPALGMLAGYMCVRGWEVPAPAGTLRLRRFLLLSLVCVTTGILIILSIRVIGLWSDPETVWRQAVKVSPEHPVVRLNLGLTLQEKGAYDESIQQLQSALALKPDYAEAYSALGGTYALMGDTTRAEDAFKESLALVPENYLAISRLANMRVGQKRYKEAVELFKAALAIHPGDAFATLSLANIANNRGDTKTALRLTREVIKTRPAYGEAYYLAAVILLNASPEDPEGIDCLRKAGSLGYAPALKQLEERGMLR